MIAIEFRTDDRFPSKLLTRRDSDVCILPKLVFTFA